MRKQKGFTLIELLIVVAIIGILAAIAIPNLLNAMGRARQKRTMADMRTIATAWEARATDLNKYSAAGANISWPTIGSDISTMTALITPTYTKKIPLYDGWNNTFRIGYTDESYAIASYGADKSSGTPGAGSTSVSQPVTTGDFDCDIVISEGNFVVYPEGIQNQ
jgi:type II secretion system protein G